MRSLTAAVFVAVALCVPATAAAQEPVKSFDQLNTRLRPGDTIWITDPQGREVKGKIQALAPDALTLNADGPRTFAARDVSLIRDRQHDSLKNGTLIGLGIGGAMAALWCGFNVSASHYYPESSAAYGCAEGLVAFAGFGTLIGMGIDAAIPGKMRVAYGPPGTPAPARLSISPVVAPRTKAVAASFSF